MEKIKGESKQLTKCQKHWKHKERKEAWKEERKE